MWTSALPGWQLASWAPHVSTPLAHTGVCASLVTRRWEEGVKILTSAMIGWFVAQILSARTLLVPIDASASRASATLGTPA